MSFRFWSAAKGWIEKAVVQEAENKGLDFRVDLDIVTVFRRSYRTPNQGMFLKEEVTEAEKTGIGKAGERSVVAQGEEWQKNNFDWMNELLLVCW